MSKLTAAELVSPQVLRAEIRQITFVVERLEARLAALETSHAALLAAYVKHCRVTHGGWAIGRPASLPASAERQETPTAETSATRGGVRPSASLLITGKVECSKSSKSDRSAIGTRPE